MVPQYERFRGNRGFTSTYVGLTEKDDYAKFEEVVKEELALTSFAQLDQGPDLSTEDKIGHGTAIAGIIAGSSDVKVKATAPVAKLVPLVCQTKDADGKTQKASLEVVAHAVWDAVDVYGCRIIILSAGTTVDNTVLSEAIAYAEEKSSVVISAVGNENKTKPKDLYYPAAYSTVIGVGSVNKKGKVSNFSQRNGSVMLVAIGEKVWTVSRTGNPLLVSGTSYAAAYVCGAAAKLLSARPGLTPEEVRQTLCNTAADICKDGYDTDSGWRLLQLEETPLE